MDPRDKADREFAQALLRDSEHRAQVERAVAQKGDGAAPPFIRSEGEAKAGEVTQSEVFTLVNLFAAMPPQQRANLIEFLQFRTGIKTVTAEDLFGPARPGPRLFEV